MKSQYTVLKAFCKLFASKQRLWFYLVTSGFMFAKVNFDIELDNLDISLLEL